MISQYDIIILGNAIKIVCQIKIRLGLKNTFKTTEYE